MRTVFQILLSIMVCSGVVCGMVFTFEGLRYQIQTALGYPYQVPEGDHKILKRMSILGPVILVVASLLTIYAPKLFFSGR